MGEDSNSCLRVGVTTAIDSLSFVCPRRTPPTTRRLMTTNAKTIHRIDDFSACLFLLALEFGIIKESSCLDAGKESSNSSKVSDSA